MELYTWPCDVYKAPPHGGKFVLGRHNEMPVILASSEKRIRHRTLRDQLIEKIPGAEFVKGGGDFVPQSIVKWWVENPTFGHLLNIWYGSEEGKRKRTTRTDLAEQLAEGLFEEEIDLHLHGSSDEFGCYDFNLAYQALTQISGLGFLLEVKQPKMTEHVGLVPSTIGFLGRLRDGRRVMNDSLKDLVVGE